jgi:hypothetical protein
MPFTISNCIVTKEFIVVTYTGSPVFGQPLTVAPFQLAINAGALANLPTNASHTFVSSIPASIISWPRQAAASPFRFRVGDAFALQVTDISQPPVIDSADGFVTEGAPEAIALLQNSFDQALNAIRSAVSGVNIPDPSGAITGAATTVANAFAGPAGMGAGVANAINAAATTVAGVIGPPAAGGPQTVTGAITNAATAVQGAINAPTFPILTEEIGYPPSPLARQSGGAGGGGGAALGQVVSQALNGVLGWKLKSDDPKGFLAALNASFTCTEVEGHTLCTWQQRNYVVQSDITGGIAGAQASIFARAKDALDQSLPLLNGLYALDPTAEPERVYAFREVVRDQLTQVVNEFGYQGGPRVARVNTYFTILLGNAFVGIPPLAPQLVQTDSDLIGGTLGALRDTYGIFTARLGVRNLLINTVDDEQDTTNFRVLADYVTSLTQSWVSNIGLLAGAGGTTFFGTQLVLISRQLTVVSEDVDEVRFALDSVFIGPDERQALQVNFNYSPLNLPLPAAPPFGRAPGNPVVMFFEDFAGWAQNFVSEEAPQLIQSGGIIGVRSTVLTIIQQLEGLAFGILDVNNPNNPGLPLGFHTGRVQQTLQQLDDDLVQLFRQLSTI